MLKQKIDSLKLAKAMLELSREHGTRHGLLDLLVLLVVNENPGSSQLDVEEQIYNTRRIYNGTLYKPFQRLIYSAELIESRYNEGASTKKGQNRTSLYLTRKGERFLKNNSF